MKEDTTRHRASPQTTQTLVLALALTACNAAPATKGPDSHPDAPESPADRSNVEASLPLADAGAHPSPLPSAPSSSPRPDSGSGGDEGAGGLGGGMGAAPSAAAGAGGMLGTGGGLGTGGFGATQSSSAGAGGSAGSTEALCSDRGQDTAAETFVHPGGLHKNSDLDRMRLMVRAGVEPWASAFEQLRLHSSASANYTVRGDASQTVVNRDGTNGAQFEADATAAYSNALMWAITGDELHAKKSVEIFNAWSNVTEVTGGGTEALNAGLLAWKMVEAAELIRSTYDAWSASDVEAFSNMLVYPGYSNSESPASLSQNLGTFYWRIYQGDPGRHGNQDLIAWRAMISLGVFLDNRIVFERALRYFKGEPHRADDLPYPAGPPPQGVLLDDNEYFTTYRVDPTTGEQPDYGYNGVLENYVWPSGQTQESSRDQQHAFFGLGICAGIAEVAWNQGDGVYNAFEHRLLRGFEHLARYNVSFIQSFEDQPEPWEPSGSDFVQQLDRTGRWFSKQMNPYFENDFVRLSRGDFPGKRPVFEQPFAHYSVRMGLPAEQTLWTQRGRDVSIERGGYEGVGFSLDHPGWGALTFRRPAWAAGDPIDGFDGGVPRFAVPELPGTVRAVHYDHFPISGEGRTYHDSTPDNLGARYRRDAVDIACGPDGLHVVSELDSDEWLAYTVFVPEQGSYPLSITYSASANGGAVRAAAASGDLTENVALPNTDGAPSSRLLGNVELEAGVQTLRIVFSGALEGASFADFVVGAP